jgi:hypothetical protein
MERTLIASPGRTFQHQGVAGTLYALAVLFITITMHTSRRKSQIYPVALAITLLIASKAHAQLCLATAESKNLPAFAEQASLGAPPGKASGQIALNQAAMTSQPSQSTAATTADFGPALSPTASVEVSTGYSPPQVVVVQNVPGPSSRPQDNLVRKLVLAVSQPALAEAGFQSLFAD